MPKFSLAIPPPNHEVQAQLVEIQFIDRHLGSVPADIINHGGAVESMEDVP